MDGLSMVTRRIVLDCLTSVQFIAVAAEYGESGLTADPTPALVE